MEYTIAQLIDTLFPERDESTKQDLVTRCQTEAYDYSRITWSSVSRERLLEEVVQLHLVRTLYQVQFGYQDVVDSILKSFLDWTDGTAMFGDFPSESDAFLQTYFTLLGFTQFPFIDSAHQIYLLGSRCLPLGFSLGLSVDQYIGGYFQRLLSVEVMREQTYLFAGVVRDNPTPIGDPGRVQGTVGDWVILFEEFATSQSPTLIDDFLADHIQAQRLPQNDKRLVGQILILYVGLRGGFLLWKAQEDLGREYHGEGIKQLPTVDGAYLQLLYKQSDEEFLTWLQGYENVMTWIINEKKSEDFINELTYILTKKVDLSDEEQVSGLMALVDALHQAGWSLGADMLYFDEQVGKFEWNEELLGALEEEVLENRELKKKGKAPSAEEPEKPKPRIELAS